MSGHTELETWQLAWKSPATTEPAPAADIVKAALRQERRLRLEHIFSLAFAAVLTALPFAVLYYQLRAETIAWSIVVWITTIGATSFSIWNWRGLWKASTRASQEYAAAYRKRALARLQAVRFGYAFLALQLAIATPWLTWDFYRGAASGPRYAFSMVLLAALTVAFILRFRQAARQSRSELQQIDEFERD